MACPSAIRIGDVKGTDNENAAIPEHRPELRRGGDCRYCAGQYETRLRGVGPWSSEHADFLLGSRRGIGLGRVHPRPAGLIKVSGAGFYFGRPS